MKELKAQDLRIGNLIFAYYEGENGKTEKMVTRVNQLDTLGALEWEIGSSPIKQIDIDRGIEYYDDISPIPLTEEWANRHDKKEWEFVGFGTRQIWQHRKFQSIKFELVPSDQFVIYINDEPINVKDYVHEWQNLFQSLTGEELTLKA